LKENEPYRHWFGKETAKSQRSSESGGVAAVAARNKRLLQRFGRRGVDDDAGRFELLPQFVQHLLQRGTVLPQKGDLRVRVVKGRSYRNVRQKHEFLNQP